MSEFVFRGKKIHYESDGEGSPLLILNGIMMSTNSWIPFIPTLKERFRVLRLDFLDQGSSDKLIGETYTQDLQVELVLAFFDHLGISSADVVGISYGGEVALLLASAHPARVRRLILFNTCAYTSPWLQDIGRGWIDAGKTRDGQHYYRTTIPVIYSPHFYESRLEWMKQREKILVPVFSNPLFLDQLERLTLSAEPYDVRDRLHNITAQTLIVSAEEDYLTPVPNQEQLYRGIQGSEWIKIPFAGHASMYEKPLLFTSLVYGFCGVQDTKYPI